MIAAFHAVMNAKTSQGAIAWGISLVTFPWLALPLYAVLGRGKFQGYVLLRHAKEEISFTSAEVVLPKIPRCGSTELAEVLRRGASIFHHQG
jgi:hypothetical protein